MTPTAANRQDLHNNRLCDWDTARQLSSAGRRVSMEGLMADWTTLRLNLRYHWTTVLLWSMGIGGALVLVCWLLLARADAWVENYPGLPLAEGGLVVVGPFCLAADCTQESRWRTAIQSATYAWNEAGANFLFTTRAPRPTDDPCYIRAEDGEEGVFVIFSTYETVCAAHQKVFDSPAVTVVGWPGRAYYVHINLDQIASTDLGRITQFLIHELGHTVGLGHPDEAGQQVAAIMNSHVVYTSLQPDDIAGIRALHGVRMAEPEPEVLVGFLENPRDGSAQSGIGVISGWVCDAVEAMEVVIFAADGRLYQQEIAYGTERLDTAYAPDGTEICGDTDNGFGLLFNWNNLGEGRHEVLAYVGEQELGRATVTVVMPSDEPFKTGLTGEGTATLSDGTRVWLQWEESLQNFVITERR